MIRQVTIEIEGESRTNYIQHYSGEQRPTHSRVSTHITTNQNAHHVNGYKQGVHREHTCYTRTHSDQTADRNVNTQEGKWQPSFQNIIENVIGNCTTCLPKRSQSAKPHGTLPKAMNFNNII